MPLISLATNPQTPVIHQQGAGAGAARGRWHDRRCASGLRGGARRGSAGLGGVPCTVAGCTRGRLTAMEAELEAAHVHAHALGAEHGLAASLGDADHKTSRGPVHGAPDVEAAAGMRPDAELGLDVRRTVHRDSLDGARDALSRHRGQGARAEAVQVAHAVGDGHFHLSVLGVLLRPARGQARPQCGGKPAGNQSGVRRNFRLPAGLLRAAAGTLANPTTAQGTAHVPLGHQRQCASVPEAARRAGKRSEGAAGRLGQT